MERETTQSGSPFSSTVASVLLDALRAPALYAGQVANHISVNVQAALNWKTLLGNCLFLQTIATPTFGSNTPSAVSRTSSGTT